MSPGEHEALRALRAALRPIGVRVHVDTRGGTRYRFTCSKRSLYATDDRLSALAFGAGLVAGHREGTSSTRGNRA